MNPWVRKPVIRLCNILWGLHQALHHWLDYRGSGLLAQLQVQRADTSFLISNKFLLTKSGLKDATHLMSSKVKKKQKEKEKEASPEFSIIDSLLQTHIFAAIFANTSGVVEVNPHATYEVVDSCAALLFFFPFCFSFILLTVLRT